MNSYISLAMVCEMLQRAEEEVNYEQKALQIARKIGDRDGEARILHNHSVTLANRNDINAALSYSQDAIRIHKDMGNTHGYIFAQNNMASYYIQAGQYEQAWLVIANNLDLVAGRGFGDIEVNLLITAARWCIDQKYYPMALEYLAKAEQLVTALEYVNSSIPILKLKREIATAIEDSAQAALYQAQLHLLEAESTTQHVAANITVS